VVDTEVASLDVTILELKARIVGPADIIGALSALYPAAPAWTEARGAVIAESEGIPVFSVLPREDGTAIVQIDGNDGTTATIDLRQGLLATLEWAIASVAVEVLGEGYLLLHAGAVARGDHAILLPASSGSGKSTLTAGLVAAGFALASDEVGVLDPLTLELLPFARGICVKAGSRPALARWYPSILADAPHHRFGGEEVWYLSPSPDAWLQAPTPVRSVVVPRYQPGVETRLEPMARPDVLPILLEQSFSVPKHGGFGIQTVTRLLQRADCYRLTFRSLDEAVVLLRDFIGA
jgi:HprK-related kinase A